MRDDDLGEDLRRLAGHGARTGRLSDAADIRRRGERRRKRRQVSAAALAVAMGGLLTAGIAVARPDDRPRNGLPAGPSASAGPTPSRPVATSVPVSPSPPVSTSASAASPPTTASSAPADPPSVAPPRTSTPGTPDSVLSGKRQVAIVRAQAFESGVSLLDDSRVAEVDDDSGRRLFVLVPLGGGNYLIRTAEPGPDGERSCWRSRTNGSDPLTVVGAACSANDRRQRFAVTRHGQSGGQPTYAIANLDAFLQFSSRRGLILEELGDATLTTTFRLVDNGDAPASGD
jgi:hypothetical protein